MAEMGSFTESEKVKQFRDIVTSDPKSQYFSILQKRGTSILELNRPPNAMVMAFLSKACSYGSALFLNYGSLVCNRLSRTNVTDKLLYYTSVIILSFEVSRCRETYANSWHKRPNQSRLSYFKRLVPQQEGASKVR